MPPQQNEAPIIQTTAPTNSRKKLITTTALLAVALFVLVALYVLYASRSTNIQSDANAPITVIPETKCDPTDPRVTENVTLKGPYPFTKITQGSHTFLVVSANNKAGKWMNESPWEVCGLPVVFVQNLGFNNPTPESFVWNGNEYTVPSESTPMAFVHHQLAYKAGFFGKGTVDGQVYDFADVSSRAYSVNGAGAIIQAVSDASSKSVDKKSVNVIYKEEKFGPYASVIPHIVSVNGEPTYFASEDGQNYSLYQSGKVVSPPGVVGFPPSEKALVNYKGQPAYILGTRGGESTVYIGSQSQGKKFGNAIELLAVGDKLAANSISNQQPHIFLDGKDLGFGSSMYAAAGTVGYLSGDPSAGQYDFSLGYVAIMRGTEKVGTIDHPSVFYPSRSYVTGVWGDLTFVGDKPAYVYRGGYTRSDAGNSYGEEYVKYGDEKIFSGYSVGLVANIGGKLVIKGSKDRIDYVFVEE